MPSGPAKAAAVALALTGLALGGRATDAAAQEPANLDVFFEEARASTPAPSVQAARLERRRLAEAAGAHGFPSEFDEALGVPTFLWAQPAAAPPAAPLGRKTLIESWGREYLARNAVVLGLTADTITQAELTDAHDTGRGALIARFQQKVAGLPVFNRRLNVMMKPSGALVAVSGYFAVDLLPAPAGFPQFLVPAAQAAALGFAQLGGLLDASDFSKTATLGEYALYSPRVPGEGVAMTSSARVRKVLYAHPLWLEPAFYVDLTAVTDEGSSLAYAFVISAVSGKTLFRMNLGSHAAYSYRVFADGDSDNAPFDSPLGNGYSPFPGSGPDDNLARIGVPGHLITLDHGPISTGDPWLPEGATVTTGNNVDAYLDSGVTVAMPISVNRIPNNDYVEGSGDRRAAVSGDRSFDYAVSADQDPSSDEARDAANVNLFYVANWLHDWWYDHGFDEAAGNAQASNFGRGGVEADPMIAQGQDAGGRNNASMAIFPDGRSPVMQMYLWDAFEGSVQVHQAGGASGLHFAAAHFGPAVYDVRAVLGIAAGTDGCADASSPAVPAPAQAILQDKVALLHASACAPTTQARFAQASGAVAAVIANADASYPGRPGGGPEFSDIRIPVVTIGRADGQRLESLLAVDPAIEVQLQRVAGFDRDGSLDNQIVAHEYFHYVSNRLVGDGTGLLSNNQGASLGEGWSDLAALLLSVPAHDGPISGAYSIGGYATGEPYFGLRRVPYSTAFSRNALTFGHIADASTLPGAAPIRANYLNNAEMHNSGEVWASLLLECYAGLRASATADLQDARRRMQGYLIAGLKATPVSPTFNEARDALLAAAEAGSHEDFQACARGFARRGAGVDAISPARDSIDHAGVVESYAEADGVGRSLHGPAAAGGTSPLPLLLLALAGFARQFRSKQQKAENAMGATHWNAQSA